MLTGWPGTTLSSTVPVRTGPRRRFVSLGHLHHVDFVPWQRQRLAFARCQRRCVEGKGNAARRWRIPIPGKLQGARPFVHRHEKPCPCQHRPISHEVQPVVAWPEHAKVHPGCGLGQIEGSDEVAGPDPAAADHPGRTTEEEFVIGPTAA